MNKFPLTSEGASELLDELYALPQSDLQTEADAAGNDFPLWTKTHFELDSSQEDYLNNIDPQWIEVAAEETKHALENRLPIVLNKDTTQKSGEEGGDRGKLLDLDKNKKSSFSPEDGFSETGSLTYTITYPAKP